MKAVPVNLQDVSEAEFMRVFRGMLRTGDFVFNPFDGGQQYDSTDFLQVAYDLILKKTMVINNALSDTSKALTELKNGNS